MRTPSAYLAAALVAAVAFVLAPPAPADEFGTNEQLRLPRPPLSTVGSRKTLGTSATGDTVWVGRRAGNTGNYWEVGVGPNRPGTGNHDGMWDWESPVHGDSLQGWWPVLAIMSGTGGLTLTDDQRPWWAIDIGNNVNEVLSAAPGHRRSFGVAGVWHRDPGNTGAGVGQGVGWTPLSGSYSAWCGLRRHGDLTAMDPVTGNPLNADALIFNGQAGGGTGFTSRHFPGYASQWDQMLYRDIDLSGSPGANLTLSFKYQTRMSTAYGTSLATRTGWFDKDPLAVTTGNFISSSAAGTSAPIDSFMVYLGVPVDSTYVGSDGASHPVFDPQRRWFSEVIRVNQPYREVFTDYGAHANQPSMTIPNSVIAPMLAASGGRLRLVFRNKTNRGFDDETGSDPSAYNSGGQGAVELDDVTVNGVNVGSFEGANDIDNDTSVSALDAWKSTGKPPQSYAHVHNLSSLVYQDICGPPGALTRQCNMYGSVISMGDHDRNEAAGGVYGTADQERFDFIFSPTICLKAPGPSTPNGWDLTGDMATPTEDFYLVYDIYTGVFDPFTQGNHWLFAVMSYPTTQSDGTQAWGEPRRPGITIFNPDKECFTEYEPFYGNGIIRTSNPGNKPDSIRFGLEKKQECYRFGVTVGCSPTDGAYFDNVSLAIVDVAPGTVFYPTVNSWDLYQDTFPFNENASLPGTVAFDTTAALIKSGVNTAQDSYNVPGFDVPGDSAVAYGYGDNQRADLVFRILPGPGNYVSPGVKSSGLRRVPTSPVAVTSLAAGDSSFWSQYLANNGEFGTPGGHGATWNPNVWNSARCDTAEVRNAWPVMFHNIGFVYAGVWATMYHESDPKFATLGIRKNRCFLIDPSNFNDGSSNITCSSVPAWTAGAGYAPEIPAQPGVTLEYTKIIPDGLLTPGSHVEYFFRLSTIGNPSVFTMTPDTNRVLPQPLEYSVDGHRWEQFSVLPDLWKKSAYGGLGNACMLVVDAADGNGEELAWVSIADSLGATRAAKFGAHNGWHAPGGADVNDPAYFVAAHGGQPGTTWDFYNVKGGSGFSTAGRLGSRYSLRSNPGLLDGKWSRQGPTHEMLNAYYRILMTLTGTSIQAFAPNSYSSSDDIGVMQNFLDGSTSSDPRGLFVTGSGAVSSLYYATTGTSFLYNYLGAATTGDPYEPASGVHSLAVEIHPTSPLDGNTFNNVYGLRNPCQGGATILDLYGGTRAATYEPTGSLPGPLTASVLHSIDPGAGQNWKSLLSGFNLKDIVSPGASSTVGRIVLAQDLLETLFGDVCNIGTGIIVDDVPGTDGRAYANFVRLAGNPMAEHGSTVQFGLATADRVEARVYDVSGRLVRTLADRRFPAGQHQLVWDGADDRGVRLSRGVYFVRLRYQQNGFESAKKLVMIR
jgi:hypothetical protein